MVIACPVAATLVTGATEPAPAVTTWPVSATAVVAVAELCAADSVCPAAERLVAASNDPRETTTACPTSATLVVAAVDPCAALVTCPTSGAP